MPEFEWTWFEDESLPHRGVYGVRRGSEEVCRTNAYKNGYERAKAIADALNRGEKATGLVTAPSTPLVPEGD